MNIKCIRNLISNFQESYNLFFYLKTTFKLKFEDNTVLTVKYSSKLDGGSLVCNYLCL